MKAKILLVDDDPFTQRLVEGLLRAQPVDLKMAANAAEARRVFLQTDFNLILLDQRLPDGNGLDLFAEMRRERPHQVAILITGYAEVRDAVRAVREGLFDYLTKPFENIEELDAVIARSLELDRAYREIAELRESLDAQGAAPVIIGRSAAIEGLLAQVRQVAPLDTTVLIEGESGTGKELIAQLIHRSSSRSDSPMLEVNCGALSEQLLESTLFGYEKGAFTGAAKSTAGYFEKSDGGTLFLDEIVDMSAKLQSSLLRVLQEGKFTRLGATAQRCSDFRLICATNKSLEDEVAAGRFRSDLYYRLKVVALHIPPLRKRVEDVMPLAQYFLSHFNRKFGRQVGPFTPEAMERLETATWSGNVRELQHIIERVVAIKSSGLIAASDLGTLGAAVAAADGTPRPLSTFRDAREEFECEYFSRLFEAAGRNVSEAARLSGMARQNLYPYLKRLGLVMDA
ncbi:sigma-54-dependent transcriptional regulator [Candidatus Ferrigenium straubiae]|jgi:two-component system response regulator HydG|uniref:sigma-54-dependent transcriptional regulator n=1 Tax=Candidatus Ferrigenium straubiae TaxID=2919506 RepID=UPI003F4ACB40